MGEISDWLKSANLLIQAQKRYNISSVPQVISNEVNMAKRRNPKKEKAQRNLAYARKFRKRTHRGYTSRRSPMESLQNEKEEKEKEENEADANANSDGG